MIGIGAVGGGSLTRWSLFGILWIFMAMRGASVQGRGRGEGVCLAPQVLVYGFSNKRWLLRGQRGGGGGARPDLD